MKLFFTALGLALIFEGIPYFGFPEKMQIVLAEIQKMSPQSLRWLGFISIIVGLVLCYISLRTGLFS